MAGCAAASPSVRLVVAVRFSAADLIRLLLI
jgi:hypothetical protein